MLTFVMILFCLFPMYPHTETDVRLLGNIGWLENPVSDRNDRDQMDKLMLTMAVAINRMASEDNWWHLKGEHTIYDVVFAPGQYAKSTKDKVLTLEAPDWVYELAEDMLNYGTNVPDYVIYQSMQSDLGTVWKQIGTEYFATAGGHRHEGDDFHPEINSHFGRDVRIFDYVFRNTDRTGTYGSVMDYFRWRSYFSALRFVDMADWHRGGQIYP